MANNTTKTLYYRTVILRQNKLKFAILNFFFAICSYPRLVLEVFIRKDMGERYFNLASAITTAVLLILIPQFIFYSYESKWHEILWDHKIWHLFIVVFLVFSLLRHKESWRPDSTFDLSRYSRSSGTTLKIFDNINTKATQREIETIYEPTPFALLGILLMFTGQALLGSLFILCAIVYSLSYYGAYMNGDNLILDKVDEIIFNEEMSGIFIKNQPARRGVNPFFTKRPATEELGERIYNTMVDEDERVDIEAEVA